MDAALRAWRDVTSRLNQPTMTTRNDTTLEQISSPAFQLRPNPDRSTTVVLTIDDVTISRATIVPMTIRIGAASVRMDGIGGVGTDDAHRHRGYSRRVMDYAVELMKQGDAPLTTLYGIPHFYPKFGYATVGGEAIIRLVSLDEDNQVPEGSHSRRGRPADLPRLKTLYRDGTREAVGALVRPDDGIGWRHMKTSLTDDGDDCIVITDEADEVVAYAWRSSKSWWMQQWSRRDAEVFKVAEAFAVSPRAADALLAACRQWAAAHGASMVELAIPGNGVLGMSAALQSSAIATRYERDAEFMGRSTGVHDLMTALQPELERRWRAARAGWTGTLELRTGEDAVGIALGEEDVAIVPVHDSDDRADTLVIESSPGNVARLVLGSFDPAELLARSGTSPDAIEVMAVLFPKRHPHIAPADRF